MKDNLKHWYDGWFYDKVIAPNQSELYEIMAKFIPSDSSVIDLACATGRFAFFMSTRCKKTTGVDLSKKNIETALKLKGKFKAENVEFLHGDGGALSDIAGEKYDVAAISYALHEMPRGFRLNIIEQMKIVADRIIIADYAAPQTKNFMGMFNYAVEYIAGAEHYKNFRTFVADGGIDFYLNKLKIKPEQNLTLNKGNTKLVIV